MPSPCVSVGGRGCKCECKTGRVQCACGRGRVQVKVWESPCVSAGESICERGRVCVSAQGLCDCGKGLEECGRVHV